MGKKKFKKNVGRFAGIPHSILLTEAYTQLSALSKALLLELAAQYDGNNNGYLSLTRNDLKARGFNSPSSNQKAIECLVRVDLITKTIQGGISCGSKHCSLYGINWQPSNERMDRPFQYSLDKGITRCRDNTLSSHKVSILIPRQQNKRPDLRLIKAV